MVLDFHKIDRPYADLVLKFKAMQERLHEISRLRDDFKRADS